MAEQSDDPETRRQGRLLSVLLVVMTGVFLGVDTAFLLTVPGYEPPWYGYVFLLGTFAANRYGYYRLAASAVVAMFPIVAFAHIVFGGAANPVVTLSYLILSPVLGAILLPIRGVVLLASVNLVGIMALPMVVPETFAGLGTIVGPLSGNAIAGALCVVYMHHRNQVERDRQERLRVGEERLRLALGAARMGTWDWNLVTNATATTPRTRAIYGYAEGEELGSTPDAFFEHVHPQDRERVDAVMRGAISGETPEIHIEHRIVRKDGRTRWVEVSGRASRDESGKPRRLTGIIADITEQREMTDSLQKAQRMEAIGRLAGGVAHDFNNLLTVIAGNTAVLRSRTPSSELNDISTATESAASLTQQLLAFSRHGVVEPKITDLSGTIRESAKLLRRVIGEQVKIEVDHAAELWLVEVDERQIHQCLLNLATNARDAMPDGGTLRLAARNQHVDPGRNGLTPGDYVVISVSDDGMGMDEETRARAFEPFFTSKEPERGTGLGLAMVFGVVTRTGGAIEVDSVPGEGTTFDLYFPRTERAAPETAAEETTQTGGNESILLVEDDPHVRKIVAMVLEHDGYRVTTAADVDEAMAAFDGAAPPFALLISDVILSKSSGPQLAATLVEKRPALRVLYMTGYAPERTLKDNPVAHAEAIQKPFDPEVFLAKVRNLLDSAPVG